MGQLVKARVIVAFTDRENIKAVYRVGDTFEGPRGRVDELIAGGYLAAVDAAKKTKAESKKES